MSCKLYKGELDDVDPVELGIKMRQESSDPERLEDESPVADYIGKGDNDPIWDFLDTFDDKLRRSWHKEDKKIKKMDYFIKLKEFKKTLPSVGDVLFIQYPNRLNSYFKCEILYITPNQDAILINEKNESNSYHSQASLVGFDYPGDFVKFYKEIPKKED